MKRKPVTVFIPVVLLTALSLLFVVQTAHAQAIPGEVLVQYKDGQTPPEIKSEVGRRAQNAKSFFGVIRNTAENIQIQARGERTPEEKQRTLDAVEKKLRVKRTEKLYDMPRSVLTSVDNTYVVQTDPSIPTATSVQNLKSLSTVAAVQPNYEVHTSVTPNDPLYSQMWNLAKIQAPQAWDVTRGSANVTVAVIDTGADFTHPDLMGKLVQGYDFINNDSDATDDNLHGTHVSGTIGASTNNSIGISGVNWNVQVLAVKVMDSVGNGTLGKVIEGMNFAASRGAKIVNLSLGTAPELGLLCNNSNMAVVQNAINDIHAMGITIVAAAGNSAGDAAISVPASCQHVIAVGATTTSDQRATFSNWGSVVDIAAPGTGIYSTAPLFRYPTGYTPLQGTSMAAPHVAGVAALMLAVNPNLTPDQIENIIKSSGDTITTDRPIGKRLNAFRAVQQAGGGAPTTAPSATTAPSPTTPGSLPADINHDGQVNNADYIIWRCERMGNGWQCINPPSQGSADINHDNIVDLKDFAIWRNAL